MPLHVFGIRPVVWKEREFRGLEIQCLSVCAGVSYTSQQRHHDGHQAWGARVNVRREPTGLQGGKCTLTFDLTHALPFVTLCSADSLSLTVLKCTLLNESLILVQFAFLYVFLYSSFPFFSFSVSSWHSNIQYKASAIVFFHPPHKSPSSISPSSIFFSSSSFSVCCSSCILSGIACDETVLCSK